MAATTKADPSVLAHPAFREIPSCRLPLTTDESKTEYDSIARLLFNAGRLTLDRHVALSMYASMFDQIHIAAAVGRPARASWWVQMDRARRVLDLDDLDKPIAAPHGASTNRYAGCGFAARRRKALLSR
jgi:hypothetical protein